MTLPAPGYVRAIAPYEGGKPIEETAREFGLDPAAIIKLASNENPLGPSPHAVQAAKDSLAGCHRYPDPAARALRTAWASRASFNPPSIR